MKNFIKGILCIALIIPIIDNVLAIVSQLTKHFCTWIAVKTYDLEKQIAKAEEEPQQTFAIGFQASSNDKYYNEDEEE